jgi:autotransporter-associated beta strand protein
VLNRKAKRPTRRRSKLLRDRLPLRLEVEALESRLAPATHIWVGGSANINWSNSVNWIGGAPTAGETSIDLLFPTNALSFSSNDDIAFTHPISLIQFEGPDAAHIPPLSGNSGTADYLITGNDFSLAGFTTLTVGSNGAIPAPVDSTDTIDNNITLVSPGMFVKVASSDNLVLNGVIGESGGASGITKEDLGTLTLTNSNSYTNGTLVSAGILAITNGSALGTGAVGVNSGATLQLSNDITVPVANSLTVTGTGANGIGAVDSLSGTNEVQGTVTMTGDTTFGVDADTLTLSGVVSGAHNLTKIGAGTLVLKADNTYTGNTNVNVGTLSIESNNALGAPGTVATTTVSPGAVLQLNGNLDIPSTKHIVLNSATLEDLAGTSTIEGNITLENNAQDFIAVDQQGDTLTLTGNIGDAGTNSELVKTGPGKLVLNPTTSNTYTGGTEVTAGILDIRGPSARTPLGTGFVAVDAGAALQVELSDVHAFLANPITLNGGPVPPGANGNLDYFRPTAFNTLTLTAPSGVTLNATSTISVDVTDTIEVPHIIHGAGGLIKAGSGTLLLDGPTSNTYGGLTTVNEGILELDQATGVAVPQDLQIGDGVSGPAEVLLDKNEQIASSAAVTILSNGDLDLNDFTQTIASLDMTGGEVNGGGTLVLNGDVAAHGGLTATINSNFLDEDGRTTTYTVDPGAALDVFAQIIDGTGLDKEGGGLLDLNGSNSYGGTTTVNAGELDLTASHSLPGALTDNGATVKFTSNGAVADTTAQLTFNGGSLVVTPTVFEDVGPLTMTGATAQVQHNATLDLEGVVNLSNTNINVNTDGTLGFDNGTDLFATNNSNIFGPGNVDLEGAVRTFHVAGGSSMVITAPIHDSDGSGGGLTKDGTGTLTLANPNLGSDLNDYTGPTTVLNGVLDVNDTQPNSAVTVDPGTLGGTGTVGSLLVLAGGTVNPAGPGAVGTLSVIGNATFDPGSTYTVDLNGTGTLDYDHLNVSGTVTLTGANLVVHAGALLAPAGTPFTIIQATGSIVGTFASVPAGFSIQYNANSVVITNLKAVAAVALTGPTASTFGQQVTYTVIVTGVPGSPTPGGSIIFNVDGNTITVPLSAISATTAQATFSSSTLSAGPHQISANYTGDANYDPSTSSPTSIALTIAKAHANVTVNPATPSTQFQGQPVSLSASVVGVGVSPSAALPSGQVNFFDNGNFIGSGTLSGGQAFFQTSGLSIGSHTITAQYVGDSNYFANTVSNSTHVQIVPAVIPSVLVPAGTDISTLVHVTVLSRKLGGSRKRGFVTVSLANNSGAVVQARLLIHGLNPHKVFLEAPSGFIGGVPFVDVVLGTGTTGVIGLTFHRVGQHLLVLADLNFSTQVIAGF